MKQLRTLNDASPDGHPTPEDLSLPRSVLRFLVVESGLRIGSQVLDLGAPDDRLAGYLNYLGFQATCAEDLGHARELEETGDMQLILVRATTFPRLIASAEIAGTIRELLGKLRPGGRLVFLENCEGGSPATPLHSSSCLAQHMRMFPGETTLNTLATVPLWRRWFSGHRSGTETLDIVTHQIPRELNPDQILSAGHGSTCACCVAGTLLERSAA